MRTSFVAARAVFFTTCFLLLWAWVALRLRVFDHHFGIVLPTWLLPAGMSLMLGGGILGLWCVLTFIVKGRGTPAPFDPPRSFVAAGPYSWVRNPIYLGGWLLLSGLGLHEQSTSLVLFSLVLLFVVHLLVVRLKEPGLRRKFGASFDDYCKAVPRWLPRW